YIFSSFGIGVAIPAEEINTANGLIESLQLLTGTATSIFITIMGVLFLVSLFGNMTSWSYGVNYVASYAARNNSMPRIFSRVNKETGMPTGAPLVNGLVASTLVIIAPFLPSQDLFWNFFALNIVCLLLAYIPIFPAFLQLRRIDPDRERPFKVAGSEFRLRLISYLPMCLLIIAILFSVVPLDLSIEELSFKIPLTIGTVLAIIAGEIVAARAVKMAGK
ncbi:MAG: amino acid permease, partial [Syntrophomonadaceae bacterium]|nr:amino acid permease [Syntrophomonadaceae bacterium]